MFNLVLYSVGFVIVVVSSRLCEGVEATVSFRPHRFLLHEFCWMFGGGNVSVVGGCSLLVSIIFLFSLLFCFLVAASTTL